MFTIYLPNAYHIHTNVLGDVCATKIQEDVSPILKVILYSLLAVRMSGVFLALLAPALLSQRVLDSGG